MRRFFFSLFIAAICLGHPGGHNHFRVDAAEFDIDAQRTVLRRLQFCQDCGAALLVTRVHPGVLVRCPDCGREQPRLANNHLLTQIYQLCRLCQSPLNSYGHHPGDMVECDNCHTRQILSRDVFPTGENIAGLGYAPGFPPGSGKKSLLYSPEGSDTAITPIPLEDDSESFAFGASSWAVTPIPRPQVAAPIAPETPPTPGRRMPPTTRPVTATPAESVGPQAIADPEFPALPPLAPRSTQPQPEQPIVTSPGKMAVEVPAVSVDLFGGRRAAAQPSPVATTTANELLARVDGTPIFATDVERLAGAIHSRWQELAANGGPAVTPERSAALRKEILEQLIDRELVIREAISLGVRPDPAAVRRRETELAGIAAYSGIDLRREAERDIIMADMRRNFVEKPADVSPGAIRDFYRRHQNELMRPRQIAMSQLVIYQDRVGRRDNRNYQVIAKEISDQLESGSRFDEVRKRYDEFPAAAGIAPPDPVLMPESGFAGQILASAGSLRKGAVFGPIMLEGMALFGKVEDERAAGPIPFAEVEKDIRNRLENEATEKNFKDWLKRLRQGGVVELYFNQ